jgi:hypothetical protein
MRWERAGITVKGSGEKTIVYRASDGNFRIESRRKPVPHSGRSGVWFRTTYFLLDCGTETEFITMKEAKEEAERRLREEVRRLNDHR